MGMDVDVDVDVYVDMDGGGFRTRTCFLSSIYPARPGPTREYMYFIRALEALCGEGGLAVI